MHQGNLRWLRVPMGLTYKPAYFQYLVESILGSKLGNHPLPIVVYLDNIAIYGDTQEQVLDDMPEASKCLVSDGFIDVSWMDIIL